MDFANHPDGDARESRYARRLEGLGKFRDFDVAFHSLERLDAIYREYREVSDRIGTCAVRDFVAAARRRVESLSQSSRLGSHKRREKREIVAWLRVWLEVPDLFFDWLEMRKQSPEFQKLFANGNGRSHR